LNGGFQETDTKGLWGIGFGNGAGGAGTNAMFFADGINQENDGLFGKVTSAGSAMSASGSEESQGQAVPSREGAPGGLDRASGFPFPL
jgi:hypothetical protein